MPKMQHQPEKHRPRLTKLPKPIRVMLCAWCDDTTRVDRDRSGDYCNRCFRPLDMCKQPRTYKRPTPPK